ncbi:GmrSD restriction endonuclease domain-containing protein [Intrasporangium flavum]|uniref:HNH endonuclease family protein n=1 Tax=Intrasporangium flavum TaxID=1428657 RepID=UPI00096BDD83
MPRPTRLSHAFAASALTALLAGCGFPALTATSPGAQPHASTTIDGTVPGSASSTVGTPGAADSTRTSTALTTPAQARAALAQLDRLPVKGRAPKTGYARDRFGPSWTDDVDVAGGHNGCDTRNDVLRRDLTDERLKPGTHGCVVLSGRLADPYTGRVIAFERGASTSSKVQIDHVVALGDAWVKGAQQLTPAQRTALANDPLNLLAVDGPTNSAKRDSDAASWLPPNRAFRCTYVARQVAVKARYHLWVTGAEKAQTARLLASCR